MNANVEKLFPARDQLRESIHDSIVDLIPGPDNPTPLVRVGQRFNAAPGFELLVKLQIDPAGVVQYKGYPQKFRKKPQRDAALGAFVAPQ